MCEQAEELRDLLPGYQLGKAGGRGEGVVGAAASCLLEKCFPHGRHKLSQHVRHRKSSSGPCSAHVRATLWHFARSVNPNMRTRLRGCRRTNTPPVILFASFCPPRAYWSARLYNTFQMGRGPHSCWSAESSYRGENPTRHRKLCPGPSKQKHTGISTQSCTADKRYIQGLAVICHRFHFISAAGSQRFLFFILIISMRGHVYYCTSLCSYTDTALSLTCERS